MVCYPSYIGSSYHALPSTPASRRFGHWFSPLGVKQFSALVVVVAYLAEITPWSSLYFDMQQVLRLRMAWLRWVVADGLEIGYSVVFSGKMPGLYEICRLVGWEKNIYGCGVVCGGSKVGMGPGVASH